MLKLADLLWMENYLNALACSNQYEARGWVVKCFVLHCLCNSYNVTCSNRLYVESRAIVTVSLCEMWTDACVTGGTWPAATGSWMILTRTFRRRRTAWRPSTTGSRPSKDLWTSSRWWRRNWNTMPRPSKNLMSLVCIHLCFICTFVWLRFRLSHFCRCRV